MPTAPPTHCPCGGTRTAGVCSRCGPRKDDRRNSSQRGYTSQWATAKEAYLVEHPTCVCCEAQGRITGARGRTGLRVDHIVPVRMMPQGKDDPLFWEESNWQSLCLACDLKHKQPIEKRYNTPEKVRIAWYELLETMRRECRVQESWSDRNV